MTQTVQFSTGDAVIADETELLEFANKVREAGGADPLGALLPSVPGDETSCLIANALNFKSTVVPVPTSDPGRYYEDGTKRWVMIAPVDTAREIARELDLDFKTLSTNHARIHGVGLASDEIPLGAIDLPYTIGNAAEAFDLGLAFNDFVLADPEEEEEY